jgi:hypothetical protein
MAGLNISMKRMQVDKTNARMVIIMAVAAVLSVFCLVASKSLWSQSSYAAKVISKKRKANIQLVDNIKAVNALQADYKIFAGEDPNVLGGSKDGSGPLDGSNARVTLDALPSKYDFPALTTSLEKLLVSRSFKIQGITGTDDEANQSNVDVTTGKPEPQPMEFGITASSNYTGVQSLIKDFEHSIRPFKMVSMTLTGSDTDLKLDTTIDTYYQPAKTLNIQQEVVK